VVSLPDGSRFDAAAAAAVNGGQGCTEAELTAEACPPATRVGTIRARIPVQPGDLVGELFLMESPDGPEAIVASVMKGVRVVIPELIAHLGDTGPAGSAFIRWSLPHYPFPLVAIDIESPLFINPSSCSESATSAALFNGYSGATATATYTSSLACPPPETVVDSAPSGFVAASEQTIEFHSDQPAATFECSIDGSASGQWSPCASPLTSAYADGPHTVWVRAVSGGLADPTPSQVSFTVDGTAPIVQVVSPAEGSAISDAIPPVTVSVSDANPTTLECSFDGEPWESCPDYVPNRGVGTHSLCARATDPAGNVGQHCVTYSEVPVPPMDTQVTHGPEGGLEITDPTPEWRFTSEDPSATFECKLDGAGWTPCTSPYRVPDDRTSGGSNGFDTGDGSGGPPNGHIDPDEAGSHIFEVRATNGGGVDPTPDSASFEVREFQPVFSATLADPDDPTDYDGNDAIAHPDVTVNVANMAGDPRSSTLDMPDYFWMSSWAVPLCPAVDAGAGNCLAASKVGMASLVADVNRVPHDAVAGLHELAMTGDVYLTQAWSTGDFGGAVAEVDVIDTDGRHYGKLNLPIRFRLDNVSTDDVSTPSVEENTSVSNARGVRAVIDGLPALSPLTVDGAQLELHTRSQTTTIWGKRSHYGRPLTHNSADCSSTPHPKTGRPVEWLLHTVTVEHTGSYDVDTVDSTQPYSVDNCDDVAFAPLIERFEFRNAVNPDQSTNNPLDPPPRQVDFDLDAIPETPTPLVAEARISSPPESSTLRRATFDFPPSVKQRVAGLANPCPKVHTQQNVDRDTDGDTVIDAFDYVACNLDSTLVGLIDVDSPLIETGQQGLLFIEDEPASSLPSFYAMVNNSDLGLNTRVRVKAETVTAFGGLGFMRASINTSPAPGSADVPSIPITALTFQMYGSATNGPIFEVNYGCQDHDVGYGNAISWSDDDSDGDGKTITTMTSKMYFGSQDSPCLPVSSDLADNPADTDPGNSPTAGDVTPDATPSWTANRSYTNSTASTRYAWFECSLDNASWRACGDFTEGQDLIVRLIRTGTAPTSGCYNIIVDGFSTSCIARSASASSVQLALENLPNVDPGCAVVSGSPPSYATSSFLIRFPLSCWYGNFPDVRVEPGSGWPLTSSLSITTVQEGLSGDWPGQVDAVAPGTTVTLTRVVGPQSDALPLFSGDAHKFAVRLRSNDAPPTLAAVNAGTAPGVAENYPSPYPLAPAIEVPFKVDTTTPTGTRIAEGPPDGALTGDSPSYLFRSDDITAYFQCRVDGGSWVACPSGKPLPGSPFVSGSSHIFEVRAWDGVNADPAPASRSFDVAP
jgi:hypothetical protein